MSLPPLPIPVLQPSKIIESASGVFGALYTADQLQAYGQQCREAALQAVMGIPITEMALANTYKADIDMSNKRALETARKPDVGIRTSEK